MWREGDAEEGPDVSPTPDREPQTVCGWQPEIWEHIAKFLPAHCLYVLEASCTPLIFFSSSLLLSSLG